MNGCACFNINAQHCDHCLCPTRDKIGEPTLPCSCIRDHKLLDISKNMLYRCCLNVFCNVSLFQKCTYCCFGYTENLTVLFAQIFRDVPSSAGGFSNLQLNPSRRKSTESKAPSCSERPLTLFHTPTHSQKGELNHLICLIQIIMMFVFCPLFFFPVELA